MGKKNNKMKIEEEERKSKINAWIEMEWMKVVVGNAHLFEEFKEI